MQLKNLVSTVRFCPSAPSFSGYFQAEKNATITATRPDGTVAATATTNASGVFDFDVSPGTYTVSAPQQEEQGHYSATVTVSNGSTVTVSLQVAEPSPRARVGTPPHPWPREVR